MGSVFFYGGVIGFGVGVLLRSVFALPEEIVLLTLLGSFVFAAVWRRNAAGISSPLLAGSIILLFVSLGLLRVEVTTWQEPFFASFENQEVVMEGVVMREPDVRRINQHLYIEESESGEMILVSTLRFTPVSYGDRVQFEGTVELPEAFETDLGRTFNYPGYLRARGVTHMVSFADVEVIGHGEGNFVIAPLLTFKHLFMNALERIVPEPQAGLGEGLLLGVKRALGEDLEEAFRRVGIIHIVVLSGYNVMIVAEAIMRLLSFFFAPRVRLIVGIAAISSFALMVGLSATVVRASIMATLVLIARFLGRITAILRMLMLAGIAMVLINPYLLAFDPGFQLSFLATLGLILLAPFIENSLRLAPTTLQIREFITATIATQIMVLPLLLFLIGEFSVVAVIVNVLVLPMVPIAMGLAFLAGMIELVVPGIALLFGFIAHLSLLYIIVTAEIFAALPFASFIVPAFPLWAMCISYALLGYIMWRLHCRSREEHTPLHGVATTLQGWTIVPFEDMTVGTGQRKSVRDNSSDTFPFR